MRLKNPENNPDTKRPAGRPRSLASRAAILEAAYTFLQDRPMASISILHIARWWSTKEALLLEAFLNKVDSELLLSREGNPLERIKEYILQVGRFFTGESGIVAARLLTAIQDNPILRREFLERVYSPRDKEIRAVVKEAIRLRQLPAAMEVSVFLDSIIGPLLARLLIHHQQIDEAFVVSVFDRVVAGTIAQNASQRP
jgi:hypothetical protein